MSNVNPVITQATFATALIVVLKSVLEYIQAMGWFNISPDEASATVKFIEAVIPIVVVWGTAFWTARKVTSRVNPTDVDGTPLTRPDNSPTIPAIAKKQEEAIKINQMIDDRRIQRE